MLGAEGATLGQEIAIILGALTTFVGAVAIAVKSLRRDVVAVRDDVATVTETVAEVKVQTDGRLSTLIEINEKLQDRVDQLITHAGEHSDTPVPPAPNGLAAVEESLRTPKA